MVNMDKPTNNRIWQFDMLKLVCAYLVILGHCLLHYGSSWFGHPLCVFIYSFHLPLFMVMSGYFSQLHKVSYRMPQMTVGGGRYEVAKRVVSYFVPYVTIGVVSLLLFGLDNRIHAWFLMAVLCSYLITLFILRAVKLNMLTMVLLVVLYLLLAPLLFHYFKKMVVMYPFFVMGVCMRKRWETIMNHKNILFVVSLVCFVVAYYTLWNKDMIMDVNGQPWLTYYPSFSFSPSLLMVNGVRYIVGAFAVLTIITGVFCICSSSVLKRFSCYGSLSLEMYLIGLCIDRYRFDFHSLDDTSYAIVCCLMAVAISVSCVWIARLIRKSPVMDFIVFGKGRIAKSITAKFYK